MPLVDEFPDELPFDRVASALLRRATRAAAGAAAVPVVLGYVAGQHVSGRVQRLAARLPPPRPQEPFAAEPTPLPVEEAVARVRVLPEAAVPRPGWALVRANWPDWPLMLATTHAPLAALGYRYPRRFKPRVFVGAGDQPIAAVVGLQRERERPAVVVVHGAMTTRAFGYVRDACLRLFAAGYHVLAPDLRGFGLTALTSEAPSSLGVEEAGDVLAAAEYLRRRGATTVGALGFSLGAAAVLGAARRSGPGLGLDGGVLAVSAPTDMRAALVHLSERPRLRDPHFGTWLTLRAAVTARARVEGWTHDVLTPLEGLRRFSAPYYGVSPDELMRRASALSFAAEIPVPVLALHGRDDPTVPVAHAERLARAAAGNANVHVLLRRVGGHAAFAAVDPTWTTAVERTWFGAFARSSC